MITFGCFRYLHKLLAPIAVLAICVLFCAIGVGRAQGNTRARDLGIPFDGKTGHFNAITDVKGVEVGSTTLISGDGPLKVGVGPVRTGVTALYSLGVRIRATRCSPDGSPKMAMGR